jgi:hypothetical protein
MKRLALALATAALGAGCYTPPVQQYGSVDLYWDFFRFAPAQTTSNPLQTLIYDGTFYGSAQGPCTQSAVETVTVDSAAGQVTVDCVGPGPNFAQGIGVDFLPAGSNDVRVRGWRGAVLVYDTSVTIDVPANLISRHYIDVMPMAAPFSLSANLFNSSVPALYPTCLAATPSASGSPPNLKWQIRDVVHGDLIDTATVGCGLAQSLPAPVLVDYLLDLDDFQVRVQGLRVEDNAIVLDSCWQPLSHFATGSATVRADTPVPSCPP